MLNPSVELAVGGDIHVYGASSSTVTLQYHSAVIALSSCLNFEDTCPLGMAPNVQCNPPPVTPPCSVTLCGAPNTADTDLSKPGQGVSSFSKLGGGRSLSLSYQYPTASTI
jgi:hypothetical protein